MLDMGYRLFEMVALVICLHSIHETKRKVDIYNIGFITVELIFMKMIDNQIVSNHLYFAMYLIYFIYAYIEFDDTIRKTIFKCLISICTVGILQIIVYIPMNFLYNIIPNANAIIFLINFIVFLIIFMMRNSTKYKRAADYCMQKEWILRLCSYIWIVVMIYCMYSLKHSNEIKIDLFVLMGIFMTMLWIIVYRWQKASYEVEKKERELQITNLYNDAFKELINTMRNKQHDFNNQMDAIYSMHLTANSLEELIEMQKEHCDKIVYDNRFSKVLSNINNSTLSGFIYTKFIKAEQQGIVVDYDVSYIGKTSISLYDLVEIIGIFMDNAIEAVMDMNVNKRIIFEMQDFENKFYLCVRNPVNHLSNNDISKFFERGYSTKGQERGIGLDKLKEFQKKYAYDISASTYEEDNNDWIEFNITENR